MENEPRPGHVVLVAIRQRLQIGVVMAFSVAALSVGAAGAVIALFSSLGRDVDGAVSAITLVWLGLRAGAGVAGIGIFWLSGEPGDES